MALEQAPPAEDEELTELQWGKCRRAIYGYDPEYGFSHADAALAAGVPVKKLEALIVRSRENRPGDPAWLRRVWKEVDSADEQISERLEAAMFKSAIVGDPQPVTHKGEITAWWNKRDNTAALKMLSARDKRYRPHKQHDVSVTVALDDGERYRRVLAAARLAEAQERIGELQRETELERAHYALEDLSTDAEAESEGE